MFFKPVEITNWVFEKKIYDTLELDTGTFNQSNTLYYNQFEPFIYGIGNTIPNFLGFVTPALDKIIQAVPTPSGTSKTSLGVLDNSYTTQQILTGKFGFRVEFLPVLSNKIRIFKDPIEFSDSHEHSLYGNQSTNTPNIQNLISNIKSNLNRMANNSMSQEIVIGNYSDRFKVGQKYGDFIVSEATHKIYDDNYMKSTATFSKYWNRLSSQIGINQEERQYKILLNEKTLRKLVKDTFRKIQGGEAPLYFR